MDNFLECGRDKLTEIKAAIADAATKEEEFKDIDKTLKARQKEYDIQRKRVDEKINSAVKKARTELEKGFDEQINTAEKAKKDAEQQKKTAKAEAINRRMQIENSALIDENKVMSAEIDSRFKESKVPFICKCRLYYMLFLPSKKIDYIVCAAAILIFAGLIPFIVTRFISSVPLAVIMWILIAVFFGAIYFLISALSKKGDRNNVIAAMRVNIERISDNKKFIKKRNKNIKADPDESQYDLAEFDAQLDAAKNQLDDVLSRKEQAVKNFEEVESVSIRDKVENENADMFSELNKDITRMTEDRNTKETNRNEAAALVADYAAQLGDKNMKADKIDELINAFDDPSVTTITQALDFVKNKSK